MSTTATLDIFSGRPNPVWELTEPQIAALAAQFSAAAASPAIPPLESDGLGYRGFVVASDDPRLPQSVRVYRGVATIGRAQSHWARGVERFLMETAGDAIPHELRDALREEVL